jgi:putative membrane protein
MHLFDGGHFWGMHLIWWIIWIIFIVSVFSSPYKIPGQRSKRETPLDILKRRYANGDITKEEFQENMKTLDVFDNK